MNPSFELIKNKISTRALIKLSEDLPIEWISHFDIRFEDGIYYTFLDPRTTVITMTQFYNIFYDFKDLRDYLKIRFLVSENKSDSESEIIKILKQSKLNPNFDNNLLISWAGYKLYRELVKLLLKYPDVNPEFLRDNFFFNGDEEMSKLILDDPRLDITPHVFWYVWTLNKKGYHKISNMFLENKKVKERFTKEQIENAMKF